MAQTPKGEPRSVPDGAGEQFDGVLRKERLRREAAEYFSPFKDPLEAVRRLQPVPVTFRTDDGRAIDSRCLYVDPDRPLVSPAVLAEQQRGIQRAFFMADNPFAGVAYSGATLANASPGARDAAMIVGGVAGTALMAAAPRGAPSTRGPRPPGPKTVQPFHLPPIRYRELNTSGDAQGINGILAAPLSPTTERIPEALTPNGLQPFATGFWNSRGHLGARQLGGSSSDPRNFAALTQNPTNSPWMKSFEDEAARRVGDGEVVDYSVTPFGPPGAPPALILMTANGPSKGPVARLIANPVKPRGPPIPRLATPPRPRR